MSNRENAVALAKMGFEVFPLKTNEKVPAIAVVTGRTTNDPKKVGDFWTDPFGESRDLNIGVSTDRLLVVDFDMKLGRARMDAAFEALREKYGAKHVVETPSGGLHVYYRMPPGVQCANTSKKLGPMIDTRSHHGYVLGAGSSINGVEYKWVESAPDGFKRPSSIDDLAIAPADIIAACGAPTERSERQIDTELDTPAAISQAKDYLINNAPVARQGGGGDAVTYSVACRVRDFGVSHDSAFVLMSEHWNETKAKPPWAADELEKKVENAYQYAKGSPHAPGSEFEAVDIGIPISEPGAKSDTAPLAKRKSKIQQESFGEACENAITTMSKPLVKGLINCSSVLAFYGQANVGKSFLAIELGRCVAMGAPFAGRATERGAVLYFGLEAPQGLRRRFAVIRKHKTGGAEIPMSLFSGSINILEGEADVALIVEEIEAAEKKYGIPVKLIILDTLTKATLGAQLNDDRDMSVALKRAETIKDATGVCVGVVHHAGKDLSKGMKGSTAIRESVDTALSIEADKRKPGAPGTGKIVVNKQRDLDYAVDIPYLLDQKDFWTDPETLEVHHSCVVEFPAGSRVLEERAANKERDYAEAVAEVLVERGLADGQSLRWKEIKSEVSGRLSITLDTLQKWTNAQASGDKLFAGEGRQIEFKKLSGRDGNFIKLLLDNNLSSETGELEADSTPEEVLPPAARNAEMNAE